jgi:hypothetical protein
MNCKENDYIVHSENRYYMRCWLWLLEMPLLLGEGRKELVETN